MKSFTKKQLLLLTIASILTGAISIIVVSRMVPIPGHFNQALVTSISTVASSDISEQSVYIRRDFSLFKKILESAGEALLSDDNPVFIDSKSGTLYLIKQKEQQRTLCKQSPAKPEECVLLFTWTLPAGFDSASIAFHSVSPSGKYALFYTSAQYVGGMRIWIVDTSSHQVIKRLVTRQGPIGWVNDETLINTDTFDTCTDPKEFGDDLDCEGGSIWGLTTYNVATGQEKEILKLSEQDSSSSMKYSFISGTKLFFGTQVYKDNKPEEQFNKVFDFDINQLDDVSDADNVYKRILNYAESKYEFDVYVSLVPHPTRANYYGVQIIHGGYPLLALVDARDIAGSWTELSPGRQLFW